MTDNPQTPDPGDTSAQQSGEDRDHGHPLPNPDAPLQLEEMDAANRSLAEALRVSFGLLKVIMFVLVVLFAFSGLFKLEANELAVKLRFGRVVTDQYGDPIVYHPGSLRGSWPEPIERVIKVPTTVRSVSIRDAFWFDTRGSIEAPDIEQSYRRERLEPGIDGYLLTGDTNIVHARLIVGYKINDPVRFVKNVSASGDSQEMLGRAEQWVRLATEQAAVKVVAGMSVDDFLRRREQQAPAPRSVSAEPSSTPGAGPVPRPGPVSPDMASPDTAATVKDPGLVYQIQTILDGLGTGIHIDSAAWSSSIVAPPAREAFEAKTKAESKKRQAIEDARKKRDSELRRVAGSNFAEVIEAIDDYARARDDDDAARVEEADARLAALVTGDRVGGDVAVMISEAQTDRTRIDEDVRAEVKTFNSLLEYYRLNPTLMKNLLWQGALATIMEGSYETFYLPPGENAQLYLDLNRDPELTRQRESERFEQMRKREHAVDVPWADKQTGR